MHFGPRHGLPFELAYLACLTRAGLKPLSRWERPVSPAILRALRKLDLKTRTVERTVASGQRVPELVFSIRADALDRYLACFDGRPVDRGPRTMRIEGRLFGYPTCCVESYVRAGYARNGLREKDQRILFHWACPHCRVTPVLLPRYRRIHRASRWSMRTGLVLPGMDGRTFPGASTLRHAVAATAVFGVSASAAAHDPHWLPLGPGEDPDGDLLASWEETILGTDHTVGDEDGNGTPDGADLALALASEIAALPTEVSQTAPYLVHFLTYGLEGCGVCGENVNMGFMEITNPLEGLSVTVPYVALHAMEHGSFSYVGDIHTGRLNVPLLHTILRSSGAAHLVSEPAGTDGDGDGLRDREEPPFMLDPGDPDTDGDAVRDGLDLSRTLLGKLRALPRGERSDEPYVIEHPMDGVEMCPRCGSAVVMDVWDVINPLTGAQVSVPSMALHYLEHGGFAWEGGILFGGAGRVDPLRLHAVLHGHGDGHLVVLDPDADADGLQDPEEHHFGGRPGEPDSDADGVFDGVAVARRLWRGVEALSNGVHTTRSYRIDHPLRGTEPCPACGAEVNMGYVEVVDPRNGLQMELSYLQLHYLEKGSLAMDGAARVDPLLLEAILRPGVIVAAGEGRIRLRWQGEADTTYQVRYAGALDGPWSDGPVYPGEGALIVHTDTAAGSAPRRFYRILAW